MRGKVLRLLAQVTYLGFAAALASVAASIPTGALTNDPSSPSEQQQRLGQDRCEFLMENVNGISLSLNPEGRIEFLNHYGQEFFGYSAEEILGKPMLGTLTPLAGFEGRDLTSFLSGACPGTSWYRRNVGRSVLGATEQAQRDHRQDRANQPGVGKTVGAE